MLKEKTGIGSGLMFAMLFSSFFGYGMMFSARNAAKYMGSNGYWGIFLAFLLTIPIAFIADNFAKRFPGKSIIRYLPLVFGKILGKLVGLIYCLLILLVIVWSIRGITEMYTLYFLHRTPIAASTFLVLITAAYLAHKGIEGISRLAAFVFPLAFVFIVLTVILSFQNVLVDHIKPVFRIEGYKPLVGALQSFYIFFPMAVVPIVYPYLTDKKKGLKTVVGSAALAGIIIFLIAVATIGTYGAQGILRYSVPILEMTKDATITHLLETFGLFFAVTWLSQLVIAVGVFYFSLAQASTELTGWFNYKWFIILLFPVILASAVLLPSVIEVRLMFDYLKIAIFSVVFALTILIWLLAIILKRSDIPDAQ
jgi:spore germination protein KB